MTSTMPLATTANTNTSYFNSSARSIIVASGLTALSMGISTAHAAGLEYTKQSILPFFEPGNYAELSYAYVDLDIKGTDANGNKIGNVMDDFDLPGAAIKVAPTPDSALAIIYEKPFGVDTIFPEGSNFSNSLGTTEGRIETTGITFLGGGKVTDNIWLYGGVEYQTLKGKVTAAQPVGVATAVPEVIDAAGAAFGINSVAEYTSLVEQQNNGTVSADDAAALAGINELVTPLANAPTYYTLNFEDDSTLVPVLGMAYEKPEIALRAALTYRAPAKYRVSGSENLQTIIPVELGGDGISTVPGTGDISLPVAGKTDLNLPQSINIDFQTGLSEQYQLLGMVNARWVDWSSFDSLPPLAVLATGEPLASYNKDAYAVEVALGKQFNPKLSGEVRVGYDSGTDGPLSLLGPFDAMTTLALSAQYKVTDQVVVSGGGQYLWLEGGPSETLIDGVVADFDDGTGYAVGMKVGYYF